MPKPDRNPLVSSRDGRLFLGSQVLDSVSSGLSQIALPWLVLDAGAGVGGAAVVFAIGMLPYVLFGLPAGVVGDRFPRRRVIWVSHAVQATAAIVIPIWALGWGIPPIPVVFATAFAVGTGRVFSDAGAFGAVASMVGREHFTSGQATLSAAWSVGLFAGPAVGGALIAWIGPAKTLGVEAAAFVVAAAMILAVRTSFDAAGGPSEERPLDAMLEGLAFIWRDRVVRLFTLIGLAWNLVATGAISLQVPLLRDTIGLPASTTGRILAVAALMGVVVPPLVTRLDRRLGGPRLLLGCIVASSIATAALGAAGGAWSALVASAAMGVVDWSVVSVFIGERQKRAPEAMQSRVGITGRMVAVSAMTAGALLAGAVASWLSTREAYFLMAIGVALIAMVIAPILLRVPRASGQLS